MPGAPQFGFPANTASSVSQQGTFVPLAPESRGRLGRQILVFALAFLAAAALAALGLAVVAWVRAAG